MNGYYEPPGLQRPHGPVKRIPFPFAQRMRRGGVAGGGLPAPDFPPAHDFPGIPNFGGGPTVIINPPDTPYQGPSTPFTPTYAGSPSPVSLSYAGAGGPVTGAGPYPGGASNPSNPGYVAPGVGPQPNPADYSMPGLKMSGYLQHGGVVPGHRPFGMPHDTVPAMLDPHEVVLNEAEQAKMVLSPREKRSLPPDIVHQMYRSRMGR